VTERNNPLPKLLHNVKDPFIASVDVLCRLRTIVLQSKQSAHVIHGLRVKKMTDQIAQR